MIGGAVFREKVVVPQPMPYLSEAAPAARAQAGSAEAVADAATGAAAPEAMAKSPRKSERLGTGHGEREYAPTRYTDFERASASPAEVLSVRYDSRPNLMARGVIPKPRPVRPDWPEPQPFLGQFVSASLG